jgi:hypothetical protein
MEFGDAAAEPALKMKREVFPEPLSAPGRGCLRPKYEDPALKTAAVSRRK